MPKTSSTALLV